MIKIGIIGGGINSAVGKAHIAALTMTRKFEIIAAAFSRDEQVNFTSGEYYGLSKDKLYIDYQSLIKNTKDKLDFVLILTPTDQHKDQVIYAFKHGINVICEKALTISFEDAEAIKLELISSKLKLYVIYNYIGYPMIKELKQMILHEKVGDIFSIQIEMPQEGFIKRINGNIIVPQEWRLIDHEIPTISLDLGVHLHVLIYYLTNRSPENVIAISKTRGNFEKIIDDVNAIIHYTNDMVCNMWYSKAALGHRNGLKLRIYGTKGSVYWEQMNPEFIIYNDFEGNSSVIDKSSPNLYIANNKEYNYFKPGHPSGFVEALSNYYFDLSLNFIGQRKNINFYPEVFGIEESIEGLKLFSAISKSSLENTWVEI
jgi:predicted dehydrogenase